MSVGPICCFHFILQFAVVCRISCSLIKKKIYIYNSSVVPKTLAITLPDDNLVFNFSGVVSFCKQTPFHTQPLRFRGVVMYPCLVISKNVLQKCVLFTFVSNQKSLTNFSSLSFLTAFKKWGTHRAEIFKYFNSGLHTA